MEFVNALTTEVTVETEHLLVGKAALPEIDEAFLDARYAALRGGDSEGSSGKAWQESLAMAAHFRSFDAYLISLPMWNFGVPYALKHYIDLITQPGALFEKRDGHLLGLCAGRPVCIVHASGGEYLSEDRASLQHTIPYLRTWLGFIGIGVIDVIDVSSTSEATTEPTDPEIISRVARRFAARLTDPRTTPHSSEFRRSDHA